MEKKFKVESNAWYGTQWAKKFYTFEEAKRFLREKIVSPEMVPHIIDHINDYAKEFYPQNTPVAFGQLATILTNLLTDPNYPEKLDDVVLDDFQDDNIEFYMEPFSKAIFCYVNNDEYDGKFPLAEIDVMKMDDEDEEYYFYLTERRNGMCWSQNKSLSKIGAEEDDLDDEDFED